MERWRAVSCRAYYTGKEGKKQKGLLGETGAELRLLLVKYPTMRVDQAVEVAVPLPLDGTSIWNEWERG
jgi:hypothetical protein